MEFASAVDGNVPSTPLPSDRTTTEITMETDPVNVCLTPGCGKPANMACPTCLKLGLPSSRFCDQDCFKSSWATHKVLHKEAKSVTRALDPSTVPPEFRFYSSFTGQLRPWQQSPKRIVPDGIERPDYADHPAGASKSEADDKMQGDRIKVYTAEEIAGIRAACVIGREVLDQGGLAVKAGVTTDEIDRVVHEATIARNAYPSPLGYYKFPKSVCTSVNEGNLMMYLHLYLLQYLYMHNS